MNSSRKQKKLESKREKLIPKAKIQVVEFLPKGRVKRGK